MAKILYVEDDPSCLRLIQRMLQKKDHEVLGAPDGLVGVELAIKELPDLILMDINLPGIDGLEVTRRIRAVATLRHIPIIALSAYVTHYDKEQFTAAGFDGYLAKPITQNELFNALAYFLGS